MQRQPRLNLRRVWFMRAAVSAVTWLWIAAAVVVPSLAQIQAPLTLKLADAFASLPLVPWLASLLPRGDSPFLLPWDFLVLLMAMIPVFVCVTRLRHHQGRLNDEDHARDIANI
jgi:hypothetical protein